MEKNHRQSLPPAVPIAVQDVFNPIPPQYPNEKLLQNYKGEFFKEEVLIVQTGLVTEVFDLNQEIMPVSETRRFIMAARIQNASFLTGKMTVVGSRFKSITRTKAVEKFAQWLFKII